MVGSRGLAYAQRTMTAAGDASGASGAEASEALFGPGINAPDSSGSWKEVWHYRKELLPKSLRYQQVSVEFLTSKGYGVAALKRDPAALATLEAARERFTDP
jgi:hypothetical protein